MAHAAASRSDNILKQGYLKRSIAPPDFLMSASKQLALNLKQKFEPNRWFVFGTRNGHPYLEYFDKEERVFTGQPIDTIDLSSFRNLSYTLGRTNHKHAFCLFLSNRVLEFTAPNRAQMLDWCRCLERNLRQLGYKNQAQRDDHHYSEFPVKNYKPRRTASPTEDLLLAGQQQTTEPSGSEAAENTYEDVERLTSGKSAGADAGAGAPRLPPRPPRPQAEPEEEEVFASLDSVTRNSNSDEGIYYMFDYSEEDRRLMEAHLTATEVEAEVELDNRDLGDYDNADGLLNAIQALENTNHRTADKFDDDEEEEAGERCTSLPNLPPKPSESDTSEDSDFVSASFWLRNRKDDQNLIHLNSSKVSPVKRQLPPIPNPSSVELPPPPLPVRPNGKDFRSRHCVSLYADVKPKSSQVKEKSLNLINIGNSPPPLPKRLDSEELKKLAEKDKKLAEADLQSSKTESSHREEDVKVSLGKRFDSLHVCLDPTANLNAQDRDKDMNAHEKELNNNSIQLKEHNAVENSIYGQVWQTSSTKPSSPKVNETKTSEEAHLKDQVPEKLTVAIPADGIPATCNSSENNDSTMGENGNFYSDFPIKEGEKSGACGFDSELYKTPRSELYKIPSSNPLSKSTGNLSPVLPKRKIMTKSNSSSDLDQIYSEVNEYPTLVVGERDDDLLLGETNDTPVAPPRRFRKTVAGAGYKSEVGKARNVKSDPEVKHASHSPPLPVRSHYMSERKMSEDFITSGLNDIASLHSPSVPGRSHDIPARKMSEDIDEIPLPLPPRFGVIRTQSVDEIRNAPPRPRSHISVRQKSVPQSGVVTVMNLKQTQVDILKSEIATVGGMVRTISTEHFKNGLALVDCYDKIWIAGWDVKKYPRLYDKFHIGDQVISVNDVQCTDLAFTQKIVKHIKADYVELTIRRIPNAGVFAIRRSMEGENLGIKQEGGTGEIVYVDPHGLAYKHGLRNKAASMDSNTVCNWYLTEINNRPLNLFFKDNEIQHRLLAVGKDISIVVQPSDFIQELKKQLKKIRGYKDYLVQ